MSRAAVSTGDQLANALQALGVKFIFGGRGGGKTSYKQPTRLIAALAESNDARLRLSLIPLFIDHPEFSEYVRAVAKNLSPQARLTLQCYYSAAVWLEEKYRTQRNLPDFFSRELGVLA
jgi:hypothetical protein